MLVFPQLLTGASALYPVERQTLLRTVVNTLADASTVKYEDADAASTMWELKARGLTTAEWSAIESLFTAAGGPWQTFTFLDPAGNLFAQSEDLSETVWIKGALIQLTAGQADPLATNRATQVVNSGQAAEAVEQTLAVPGSFQYCLSAWGRSAIGSSLTLEASTAGANTSRVFALNSNWRRVSMPVQLGQATVGVTFGVRLVAGASVDLFGMQAEPQAAASDYRKTGAASGVYARARFADEALTFRAQGTDVYDAEIRIVSGGS